MGWVKLQDFKELRAKIPRIRELCENAADQTAADLRRVQWKRNRKNRQYSKGWDWGITVDRDAEVTATVHNRTDWQLTWLLENGHLVTNKRGGVGFAAPHPHIEPVFEEHSKDFVEDMKDIDIEVEIL